MTPQQFGSVAAIGSLLFACASTEPTANGDDIASESGANTPSFTETDPAKGSGVESGCVKMDIVFVVDNSGSMGNEQGSLAANFERFVKVINDYRTSGGSQLDYRIAITTTDIVKDRGAYRKTGAGCDAGPSRAWLERSDPNLASAFACRAKVGITGDDDEHPLQAMQLALTDRTRDANAGFLRDDAMLAFVVLTDEDESLIKGPYDPSLGLAWWFTPGTVDPYIATFDKVKLDRSRWAAAVIAGDASCRAATTGVALDAVNLRSFTSKIGKNGTFASICAADLTGGLQSALSGFTVACGGFKSTVQ